MKQKTIIIKDKKMAYYESINNGNVVVLVHGLMSSSMIFLRQLIDASLAYNFHLVAVDLIGHGNSEKPTNPGKDYTLKEQSNFLSGFSKELGLENAVWLGHNIGGNIVMEALDNIIKPKALVLLESLPLSKSYAGFSVKDILEMYKNQLKEVKGERFSEFIPGLIQKADDRTKEDIVQSVQENNFNNQIKYFEDPVIPCELFYGQKGQVLHNASFMSFIEKSGVKNKVRMIKDSGSLFFYDKPFEFNEKLLGYLNQMFK